MQQLRSRSRRSTVEGVRLRRFLISALASFVLLTPLGGSALAEDADCSRNLNDAKPGAVLEPPVALTPSPQSTQRQLNFGEDRKPKILRQLRFTSDRALPPRMTPNEINFEALISRTGDSLESTDFPDPTFTEPRISADRKAITFSACLDPNGIAAGKYVGTVTVSGPAGLSGASLNLTVTAKNGGLFWWGISITLLITFVLLLFKDAAVSFKSPDGNWWAALKEPLRDLRWWGATAIGLGGAFGVLYGAYANDPAWGASGVGAVIALIGSAFAAIGGKSIASAFGKQITGGGKSG
jgi:hypothetical protein